MLILNVDTSYSFDLSKFFIESFLPVFISALIAYIISNRSNRKLTIRSHFSEIKTSVVNIYSGLRTETRRFNEFLRDNHHYGRSMKKLPEDGRDLLEEIRLNIRFGMTSLESVKKELELIQQANKYYFFKKNNNLEEVLNSLDIMINELTMLNEGIWKWRNIFFDEAPYIGEHHFNENIHSISDELLNSYMIFTTTIMYV